MKALILTAGHGTRLRPWTEKVPKPAIPFLQVPLVAYPSQVCLKGGIEDLIFNLHHLPEVMRATLLNSPLAEHIAGFSEELPNILGSGGGLLAASELFEDQRPWVLANGDEVLIPDSPRVMAELIESHRSSENFATLLVQKHPLAGTTFGAAWADENGQVRGFGRSAAEFPQTQPWHYLGFLVVEPEIRNYLPPPDKESNILYDGLSKAILDGRGVGLYQGHGFWGETGDLESYLDSSERVLEILPQNTYLHELRTRWGLEPCPLEHLPSGGTLLMGKGAHVAQKNLVSNFAILGENVLVENSVSLNRVVVGNGASLKEPISLQDTLVL